MDACRSLLSLYESIDEKVDKFASLKVILLGHLFTYLCLLCVLHVCMRVCYTVVPALGDPRRERPPVVYGHFVNVPTHFNVKLPLISGHLPNADADSHLLVVSTCYNGQCKQMPRFGGHFNQKSRARTQTWD